MQQLIQSAAEIIYDANLFVYYCFNCRIKIGGNNFTVKHILFTDKIIDFTCKILNQGKRVLTTENTILEIERKTIAEIVEEIAESPDFKKFLRMQSNKVPSTIKYYICRKVEEKFKEIKQKDWLAIQPHQPGPAAIQRIKAVYDALHCKSDQRIIAIANKNKKRGIDSHYPSKVDIELIDYSNTKKAPIISNDRDITSFTKELTAADATEKFLSPNMFNVPGWEQGYHLDSFFPTTSQQQKKALRQINLCFNQLFRKTRLCRLFSIGF